MSSSNVLKLPLLNDFNQKVLAVRHERYDSLSVFLDLCCFINGQRYKVINISETGVALESSSSGLIAGLDYKIKVTAYGEKDIIECIGRVAWIREQTEKSIAIEFKSAILQKDYLLALEYFYHLKIEVASEQSSFAGIPSDFKLFVYEAKQFLRSIKTKIDCLEERLDLRGEDSKNSFLTALHVEFGPYINDVLSKASAKLVEHLDLLKDLEHKQAILNFFRSELNEYLLTSPYANRAMTKPLGYAGDYEMMNQVYRNSLEGKSLFAKLMHHYTVNEIAAKSVRLRKELLINEIVAAIGKKKDVIIGSLACGPAQEIAECIAKRSDAFSGKNVTFVLIDQDLEALINAKRNLLSSLAQTNISVTIECLPVSVKHILENHPTADRVKNYEFDLLYTAGLFDYLTQPVARILVSKMTSFICKHGKLFVGNFHPNNTTRGIAEFSVDWKLIHRTEQEMSDLIPDKWPDDKSKVYLDSHKAVVYLELKK